jgi:hypothetical protein
VRSRESTLRFRAVRRCVWRARLAADLVLAISWAWTLLRRTHFVKQAASQPLQCAIRTTRRAGYSLPAASTHAGSDELTRVGFSF